MLENPEWSLLFRQGASSLSLISLKLHTGYPHLPRNLGAKPAGVMEPGSGWLAQVLGVIRGTKKRFPSRMVSSVHPGEGLQGCQILPANLNLEPAALDIGVWVCFIPTPVLTYNATVVISNCMSQIPYLKEQSLWKQRFLGAPITCS